MRYKFKAIDFWEEMRGAVGDIPCNVTDSGDEIIFDFEGKLTSKQESALKALMETKPMLRGKTARFVDRGINIELTISGG